jgi:hypothetical protein
MHTSALPFVLDRRQSKKRPQPAPHTLLYCFGLVLAFARATTFSDLVLSLPAVWQREPLRVTEIDFTVRKLADSLAVPMILVGTLLVAGHTQAILTRNMTQPAKMPARHGLGNLEPLVAAGFAACALGVLGT